MSENGWRELLVDITQDNQKSDAEFNLVRSNRPTPTVKGFESILPTTAEIGTRIEISSETQKYAYDILSKMDKGSCWLCVDYGQDGPSSDSLRVKLSFYIRVLKIINLFHRLLSQETLI